MKEEIAKTKWCPHCANLGALTMIAGVIPMMTSNKTEIAKGVEMVGNKIEEAKVSKCVASDCALWVEHDTATAEFKTDKEGHCGLIK